MKRNLVGFGAVIAALGVAVVTLVVLDQDPESTPQVHVAATHVGAAGTPVRTAPALETIAAFRASLADSVYLQPDRNVIPDAAAVDARGPLTVGTVTGLGGAGPLHMEIVEGQDQFDWGPGLTWGGLLLTVRPDGSDDEVRVRIPVWTGQAKDAAMEWTQRVLDGPLANDVVGARIAFVNSSVPSRSRGRMADGTIVPIDVLMASDDAGPVISLNPMLDRITAEQTFSSLNSAIVAG